MPDLGHPQGHRLALKTERDHTSARHQLHTQRRALSRTTVRCRRARTITHWDTAHLLAALTSTRVAYQITVDSDTEVVC